MCIKQWQSNGTSRCVFGTQLSQEGEHSLCIKQLESNWTYRCVFGTQLNFKMCKKKKKNMGVYYAYSTWSKMLNVYTFYLCRMFILGWWFEKKHDLEIIFHLISYYSKTNISGPVQIAIPKVMQKHWKLANKGKHVNFFQELRLGVSEGQHNWLIWLYVSLILSHVHYHARLNQFNTYLNTCVYLLIILTWLIISPLWCILTNKALI